MPTLIRDFQIVPKEYFKKLQSTEGIWEVRSSHGGNAVRLLGFMHEGYRNFRIGVMLKQARLNTGMSQVEVAQKLKTHKSAISRIENHAEDVKLSTLVNYAEALGKKLDILIH